MSLDNILDTISPTDPRLPFRTIIEVVPADTITIIPFAAKYLGIARTVRIKNDNNTTVKFRTQASTVEEVLAANGSETIEEWVKLLTIDTSGTAAGVQVSADLVSAENIERFAAQ